jgi:hypothetical protein
MKLYTSEYNYNVGGEMLLKGSVFSEAQWVAAGGKAADLALHVEKGYIKEAVQTVPEPVEPVIEPVEPVVEPEPVIEPSSPQGIWNFTKEELEGLPLEALNTMYKDRAAEFNLRVREYKDKAALIEKMTSEK